MFCKSSSLLKWILTNLSVLYAQGGKVWVFLEEDQVPPEAELDCLGEQARREAVRHLAEVPRLRDEVPDLVRLRAHQRYGGKGVLEGHLQLVDWHHVLLGQLWKGGVMIGYHATLASTSWCHPSLTLQGQPPSGDWPNICSLDIHSYIRLTCRQMPVGILVRAVVSVLVKFFLFLLISGFTSSWPWWLWRGVGPTAAWCVSS